MDELALKNHKPLLEIAGVFVLPNMKLPTFKPALPMLVVRRALNRRIE